VLGLVGIPLILSRRGKAGTWALEAREQIAVLDTEFGPVPYFVPKNPRRVVVLAHGYPWPDGWMFGPFLLAYAKSAARRWQQFAESNAAILLVPALGAGDFGGYREMFGLRIDADEFVNRLIDCSAAPLIRNFDGRFVLHGHSAGGQFAARYLVTHPARLHHAILSAPSTYPFPDPTIPWPNGMGSMVRGPESGSRNGTAFAPDADGWLRAASEVPVIVLVGSKDVTRRPPSPGEPGTTRLDRAKAWVDAMQRFAESKGRIPTVRLVVAPGFDHDEAAIAVPAQQILSSS